MAFVTIIFLCLALFLLIFSAGRIHAQKVLHTAAMVDLAAGPLTTLTLATEPPEDVEGTFLSPPLLFLFRHFPCLPSQACLLQVRKPTSSPWNPRLSGLTLA
jgi:hypothetical protein